MMSVSDEDQRDMTNLAAGHDSALGSLMERHTERLFHYLIRALQSQDEAADVAEETFVHVYQNRAKFDSQQKFSTWLYAIASNLVKDRYRHRERHPQVSLDADNQETGGSLGDGLKDVSPGPGEKLESTERAEAVRRAIGALPNELRMPLLLAEYEDRSQAEIGEILGCTVKAVEARIYRARQHLRVALGAIIQEL